MGHAGALSVFDGDLITSDGAQVDRILIELPLFLETTTSGSVGFRSCVAPCRKRKVDKLTAPLSRKSNQEKLSNLAGQVWRNSVSDLDILLCPTSEEQIIIRKGLKPCCLAHGKAAALVRVGVDEVVTIL